MTFARKLRDNGECGAATYIDPDGSWESVVVQGTLKITLTEYIATIDIKGYKI